MVTNFLRFDIDSYSWMNEHNDSDNQPFNYPIAVLGDALRDAIEILLILQMASTVHCMNV